MINLKFEKKKRTFCKWESLNENQYEIKKFIYLFKICNYVNYSIIIEPGGQIIMGKSL